MPQPLSGEGGGSSEELAETALSSPSARDGCNRARMLIGCGRAMAAWADGMRKGILGLAAIGMVAAPAAAGGTAPPPLGAYDGKYPHDTSLGLQFLDHPLVRRAVETVVMDADLRRRMLDYGGPKTPIWIEGGRIHSWGCERHLCGPHNWTISMKLDGSESEVCHHHADTPESGATWYLAGRTEIREFQCPSEPAGD